LQLRFDSCEIHGYEMLPTTCQLLHNCTKIRVEKASMQSVNDLEGHSRSSKLPLFDRPCKRSVVITTLVLHRFQDTTHISCASECLQPADVLQFP